MSQDVFQMKMYQIVETCPGVISIYDNLHIYGKSEKEHNVNLMMVSSDSGLVFNSRKYQITALPRSPLMAHFSADKM